MTYSAGNDFADLVNAGLSDREVAERLGVSSRTVLRWRKMAALASQWAPTPSEHGTWGRYSSGCRCDVCRAFNASWHREYRQRMNTPTARLAWRAYEPWTREEDDTLNRHKPKAAAVLLGRSYSACIQRRRILRELAKMSP